MSRDAFETWVSLPPYERDVTRWPEDAARPAWRGQYCLYAVQLAWEAWQEAQRQVREEATG